MIFFKVTRIYRILLFALSGTFLVTLAMIWLAITVDRIRLEKKHDMLDTAIQYALTRADAHVTLFARLLNMKSTPEQETDTSSIRESYQQSDSRIVAAGTAQRIFFFDQDYEARNRDQVLSYAATITEAIAPLPEDTLFIRGREGFLIVRSSFIAGNLDQIEQDSVGFDISLVKTDATVVPLYTKIAEPISFGRFVPFQVESTREFETHASTIRTSLTYYPEEIALFQLMAVSLTFFFGITFSVTLFLFARRHNQTEQNLYNLERQKDEFIAIASHELKTPLTSIKALSQILAQRMKSENNQLYESFFRKMDGQMRRMEILINDLLDVSRIRSGKLVYKMDYFDLEGVVRQICEDLTTISRTHQVTITGTIKKPVFGDRERITQVVTNLMINATKYSPQANLILVHLRETEREALVSIQDFGIGIAKENQRRIFDRFYRVSTSEQQFRGLGIGLFISSEIVRHHGGKIWVKSTRGKGSTFSFSIPYPKREKSAV
ncbi:MAG: cell wall metabolism sensor histidine kinase WalK [Patescibacteria group bacterium]|nr:cell wall metabolism sensor histidine kinase WalK [Patescibacteria group bacterium]